MPFLVQRVLCGSYKQISKVAKSAMCCSDDIKDTYTLHPSCKDKKQHKCKTWEVRKNTVLVSFHGANPETTAQTEDPICDSFASLGTVRD